MKNFIFLIFSVSGIFADAQITNTNYNPSVIFIEGNPVNNPDSNNQKEINNEIIYVDNNSNQVQVQQTVQLSDKYIEPTLENGFHSRFQIQSDFADEFDGAGLNKSKKSVVNRSFRFKKQLKNLLPHKRKKYKTDKCKSF